MKTFKTFRAELAEKKLSSKEIKRALASIKPPKKKPTLPKAPWDDKEQKEDVQELTIADELKEDDDDEDERPHTHALVDKKGHAHGFAPYKMYDGHHHIVTNRAGMRVATSDDHAFAKKMAKNRGGSVITTKSVKLKKPMDPKHANKMIGKSIKGHYHEAKEVNELNKSTLANYVKKASDDRAKNAYDVGKSGKMNYKGLKRRQGINRAVNKLAKEETIDEVLDRPGALDSYRKKADASGNKARNSATRKILTAPKDGKRPDHSDELKTMRKRNKGQDMADRVAAKQFRKSIGLGYNSKKEEAELDEISNAKMGQYVRKATDDAARRAMDAGEKAGRGDSKGFGKQMVKSRQRVKGVQKAMDKMDKNRLYGRQ